VLLVIDRVRVDPAAVAELVATVTRDTDSIYQAVDAGVHVVSHGYKVYLPVAADTRFVVGDTPPSIQRRTCSRDVATRRATCLPRGAAVRSECNISRQSG